MGSTLRFNGSLWCNLDIALRNLDHFYSQGIQPPGLSVIEAYILLALYEQDGQRASDLAHAIGRAPTAFTPILDKLETKDLIQRRPDPADRRAVRIHLTEPGNALRDAVLTHFRRRDAQIKGVVADEWTAFERVLAKIIMLPLNELEVSDNPLVTPSK